jgi:LacI family fructose operon transcriptional repressor
MTAIAVMKSLEKLGIRVPEDIAIAGFDNLSHLMALSYSITSIEQPLEDISKTAFSLMIDRIHNPDKRASRVLFPGALVLGKSTGD